MSEPTAAETGIATRLRRETGFTIVMASDGERSLVMMSEQERREEAAELIDAIDFLHHEKRWRSGDIWLSHGCNSCGCAWPCPTHRMIHRHSDTEAGA